MRRTTLKTALRVPMQGQQIELDAKCTEERDRVGQRDRQTMWSEGDQTNEGEQQMRACEIERIISQT
jgi:hypothetical protein